jgi:hypothetical protein
MSAGRGISNRLGARAIVFTMNRWMAGRNTVELSQHVERPAPSVDSVAKLVGYFTKWPACVKEIKPVCNHQDRQRMRADRSKNSGKLVLALTEARSRINVLDAVAAVGEGKAVRKAWKNGLHRRLKR